MILEMPFLTFSKADIRFAEQQLVWRTYTAAEVLPITKKVEIIDKREFVVVPLNADDKTFVIYVVALAESTIILIHLSCQAQVASLTSKKTRILAKYSEFSNVFSSDSALKLPEHTKINNHPINLLDNK